jgi:predicted alpha-1,2-mannosidase
MKMVPIMLLLSITLSQLVTAETNQLVGYVNILQGTDSTKQFSHGNTLPLVGMPWGMVDWSMENGEGKWFFTPNGRVDGIRATHQPSPWMGDYSYFALMPQANDLRMDAKARTQDYDTNTAILRPDYEKLDLKQDGITMELTGTDRCGVFRLTYHNGTTGRLILDVSDKSKFDLKIEGRTIYGISLAGKKNFPSYFVVKFDRGIAQAAPAANAKNLQHYVEFPTTPKEPVIVKVGTSFISWDQAEQNLRTEAEGTFDAIHSRVADVWNTNLGKIEIEATEDQKKTFYTCLYRAQMYPQSIFEFDAAGKPIHCSPYDKKIHDGVLYAGIGIWDGFRTTFPLLTLIYPAQLDQILQGFVNASVEGNGPLPEWPCPGYGGGMPGQHCAAIFADAVVKGLKGFDAAKAYDALRKGAFEGLGRKGGDNYLKLGYLLGPQYGAVSTTLDYAYDDWCVAQIAKRLNHPDDAKILMERSQNYRNLWDPSVGFMREKQKDGTWAGTFDEFKWMGPYCESGPWQASWFVPHDPAGLTGLVGGRDQFSAKLDKLFSTTIPPGHKPGIHEEKEMVAIPAFGQCALNNQPSFHIPYLYAVVGQPWKTQYWTRRACVELFNAGAQGFCGDEDNGSMASWYILSSIGLYPFCPGTSEYIMTSPLFPKVTIHLADKKTLVITTSNNSDKNVYIQKCLLNGEEVSKTWLSHQEIIKGGELHFEMGSTPNTNSVSDKDLPYSASASTLTILPTK